MSTCATSRPPPSWPTGSRYDQFARLFGVAGYYVDQVGDAIRAAISAAKPTIVEIPIDPNEVPTPVAVVRKM